MLLKIVQKNCHFQCDNWGSGRLLEAEYGHLLKLLRYMLFQYLTFQMKG